MVFEGLCQFCYDVFVYFRVYEGVVDFGVNVLGDFIRVLFKQDVVKFVIILVVCLFKDCFVCIVKQERYKVDWCVIGWAIQFVLVGECVGSFGNIGLCIFIVQFQGKEFEQFLCIVFIRFKMGVLYVVEVEQYCGCFVYFYCEVFEVVQGMLLQQGGILVYVRRVLIVVEVCYKVVVLKQCQFFLEVKLQYVVELFGQLVDDLFKVLGVKVIVISGRLVGLFGFIGKGEVEGFIDQVVDQCFRVLLQCFFNIFGCDVMAYLLEEVLYLGFILGFIGIGYIGF